MAEERVNELEQQIQNLQTLIVNMQVLGQQQAVTASMYAVPVPEKFSFEKEDWTEWFIGYERYRKAVKLETAEEKVQINNLLIHMGNKVNKVLATLQKKEADLRSYNETIQLFEDHYINKSNKIFQRAIFNKRNQLETETAREYIAAVIELGKKCKYDILEDELIRDRLVVGIKDVRLSETLQLDDRLTLQMAIDKIIQSESVKTQSKELRQKEKEIEAIKTQNKYSKFNSKYEKRENRKRNEIEDMCIRCGTKPKHQYQECRARNVKCNRCSLKGHFGRMCRTKNVHEVEDTASESSSTKSEIETGEVKIIDSVEKTNPPWYVKLKIGTVKVRFKVDTGADESILAWRVYKKLPAKYEIKNTNDHLVGPGQNRLNVKGIVQLPIEWNGEKTQMKAYVLDTKENLLGRPDMINLGIIKVERKAQDELKIKIYDELAINEAKKEQLSEKIFNEYPNLFSGLGKIKDITYNIKVQEAIPFCITTPRRIPFALMEATKKEIERMQKEGVIEEITEPTDYCAPMVIAVRGKDEHKKIRICNDYTELNKYVVRERFQLPSVDETLTQMRGANIFTKLDVKNGFWQLPISKQSRKYTCFITPFGRFVYKRLPQGLTSSPEVYQRTMEKILAGIPGVKVHVDDIIIYGKDEEHEINLRKTLDVLEENGITLNKNKCEFGFKKLKFLGHIIENDGNIAADPERIEALCKYPEPKNIKELQRFLGMYNYLTKFINDASIKSYPLRELLGKNQEWMWTKQHKKCFEQMKQSLMTLPVLMSYDTHKETRISADASAYGIGGYLEQLQTNRTWKPVLYCSKSLSNTEKNYAQIEKECLAIVWVCERFKQYLIGKKFEIRTDHLPLLTILKTKPIDDLSARLKRLRMRMICFNPEIKHVPGKEFYVADALSRAPLNIGVQDQDILDQQVINIDEIYNTQKQEMNNIITLLKKYVKEGWPSKNECQQIALPYHKYKDFIGIIDGILCYKDRIIIPGSERRDVLNKIHAGHQGVKKCIARAKEHVWWPQMNNHLEELIKNCERCIKNSRMPVEPLIPNPIPNRPWEIIATDLFKHESNKYLLIEDYYSGYPEIYKLKHVRSKDIIYKMKETFARHGIPEQIRCDNGPQYNCEEFKHFCKEYGIKLTTSSPHHAESNGKIERCVGAMKNLLRKNKEDFYLALLIYRNTALATGESPAKRLMGRNLRDIIPTTKKQLEPKTPDHEEIRNNIKKEQEKIKSNYDQRHRAKVLPELERGEKVWIIDKRREGVVHRSLEEPRSYMVETEKQQLRRNRRFLIPIKTPQQETRTGPQTEIPSSPTADPNKQRSRSGRKIQKPIRYLQ